MSPALPLAHSRTRTGLRHGAAVGFASDRLRGRLDLASISLRSRVDLAPSACIVYGGPTGRSTEQHDITRRCSLRRSVCGKHPRAHAAARHSSDHTDHTDSSQVVIVASLSGYRIVMPSKFGSPSFVFVMWVVNLTSLSQFPTFNTYLCAACGLPLWCVCVQV